MLMLKILIVEDDEKLSQLYKIVLNKAGYETVLASNGQEAWDIFDQEHIDLVITDVMMPVLNGYDLVKILRNENPLIPVLMITAKDDYPSKSKGFTLGIDDYMTKPIDVNEMVLRVKALMRRANINQERRLMVGATCLDYDSLTVSCGEDSIMLPQKEFLLLYKLVSYPNKPLMYTSTGCAGILNITMILK